VKTLQFLVVHASEMVRQKILTGNGWGMKESESSKHFSYPHVHTKVSGKFHRKKITK
jgi:hypothetical protein